MVLSVLLMWPGNAINATRLVLLIISLNVNIGLAAMADIPGGEYRPLYLAPDAPLIKVAPFSIDVTPVTNGEFFIFTRANQRWTKDKIAGIFSDQNYLKHWQRNADNTWAPNFDSLDSPVINVSWFAAKAYCESMGKKLPAISQWELVALAGGSNPDGRTDPEYSRKILEWYAQHNDSQNTRVAQGKPNFWGVYDLHGLIWEWTDDFNSILVSGESRADGSVDQQLFCASGSVGSTDPGDYAAFMRYGFRSSLEASYSLTNLGFRCASGSQL